MKRTYSDEQKAEAMAALLEGQAIADVASAYKIPEGTLKAWKTRAGKSVASVASPKKEEIGELLVTYLEANLEALRAQAVTFSDPDWLVTQKAEALAVLHGVMTDKAVRLLEAFGRADADD